MKIELSVFVTVAFFMIKDIVEMPITTLTIF